MPTTSQLDRVEIVLVSPRNPLNIGAVARAMANFGFAHLTVVAPYEPHWREAKSAVGAEELLQHARTTETLAEAICSATLVLGTATLTSRKPEQPVVNLPDLAPLVRAEFATGGHIALVFGPEKRGLTREDLALCHHLATIPTDAGQPSMNLGQAVAVCLYELATRTGTGATPQPPPPDNQPATAAQLDQLAGVIAETMQAADYSPAIMRSANLHDTNLLLRRIALNQRDARRTLGFFRRILWRLKH